MYINENSLLDCLHGMRMNHFSLRLLARAGACCALMLGAAGHASADPGPASTSTHPKILIIYDMEGVSGALTPDYVLFDKPATYAVGRKSLTADVNAAIRGLAKGGAGPIWIEDGHGSGNANEPDLLIDQMDPRASFDFRTHSFDPYSTGIDGSIDAIVCIGMHARANTSGFMAHTYTFDVDFRVNDVEFTETHIVAASAARWGIPVIMVSGDDVLRDQLGSDFPELEYATVKTAKSHSVAEPLAAGEAERRIETAAQRAMDKFRAGRFRPYYLEPPYDFRLSFPDYEEAEGAALNPGVMPDGDLGIRFERNSYIEGYEIAKLSINLAIQHAEMGMLTRRLAQDSTMRKALGDLKEAIVTRWLDREHAPDWSKPGPKPAPKTRYFGDT
jgi:D-amino peptidase